MRLRKIWFRVCLWIRNSEKEVSMAYLFPEEVLEHVISFIHIDKDRNVISVVCKSWCEVERWSQWRTFTWNYYAVSPGIAIKRFPKLQSMAPKGKPHFVNFKLVSNGLTRVLLLGSVSQGQNGIHVLIFMSILIVSIIVVDLGAVEISIMREVPSYISHMAFMVWKLLSLLQSPRNGVGSILDVVSGPHVAWPPLGLQYQPLHSLYLFSYFIYSFYLSFFHFFFISQINFQRFQLFHSFIYSLTHLFKISSLNNSSNFWFLNLNF